MTIYVWPYSKPIPEGGYSIDLTSRVQSIFSPFTLGPCKLWNGELSANMENAWQFSKVYAKHDDNGSPSSDWWGWARTGWGDSWAHRYPMGKGTIPKYTWWDGQRLAYIEARKQVYIPLYTKAVLASAEAMNRLSILSHQYDQDRDLYLRDFDAYDHHALGYSYDDVLNDPSRKMGHGFVLAMLLTDGV